MTDETAIDDKGAKQAADSASANQAS